MQHTEECTMVRIKRTERIACKDIVAVEAPLSILLSDENGRDVCDLTVTLRTPGDDIHLAAGLLLAESIISVRADIIMIKHCSKSAEPENTVRAVLIAVPAAARTARRFAATAACGLCGKVDTNFIHRAIVPVTAQTTVSIDCILRYSDRARATQTAFAKTGGMHGAVLFAHDGTLLAAAEDIGRHNAVDKVIGRVLYARQSAQAYVLWVSGRAGFELVQKAAVAGIAMLVSVGATTTLAIETAQRTGITLVAFTKKDRCNVYTHPQRITDISTSR